MIHGLGGRKLGSTVMFDVILALMVQHYVIVGFLAIGVGVLLNIAFTAGPDIVQSMRNHKHL